MQVEMISWITFCMGIFLMIVGIVIWCGKKIDLVHGEDASKVYECDKEAYARLLGIGVILLSFAVIASGVLSPPLCSTWQSEFSEHRAFLC